jgi:translation initiation factor RLI1
VTGNGDIIIVDQEFDVDMVSYGEAGGFGIVSFLLGAIRA